MGFFDEWKDNKRVLLVLAPALTAIMYIALLGLYTNLSFPLDKFAMIYASMLMLGIIVAGMDFLIERNPLFSFVYAGKSFAAAGKALLAGVVLSLVTLSATKTVFFPSFATTPSTADPLFLGLSAGFFFVVLIAPYAEEKFFRMTIMPTFQLWLRNFKIRALSNSFVSGTIAAVITSLFFGLYHFAAYGGNIAFIQTAFIFSMIAIVGNYALKSAFFGVGLHLGNNFIAYGFH